jgi:adenine-specific DNA-methyltransferase
MDLFYFFFHLALDVGKENAQIAFVTTNYYPTAMGARKLRQDLKERGIIRRLVNFNELKIFEAALGQHNMITILQKGQNDNAVAKTAITQRQGVAKHEILRRILGWEDPETAYYNVKQKNLYDGEEYYIRLTGNSGVSGNPAQVILDKVKKAGTLLGNICRINNGIHSQADYLSAKKYEKRNDTSAQIGDGIYVLDSNNPNDKKVLGQISKSATESSFLRPFYKNSDVHRYFTSEDTTKKIIYVNKQKDDVSELPLIKKHLDRFKTIINDSSDNAPYLHRPKTESDFIGPKIVAPHRSHSNIFGYNEIPWYASADVYFITKKDKDVSLKYVLALLNSRLYFLWLYYRGKRKGETLELYQTPLSEIPIKKISKDDQKPFIDLVDKILAITKDDDYLENTAKQAKVRAYEKQIDQMVYELYGLTKDEIKIVEGSES